MEKCVYTLLPDHWTIDRPQSHKATIQWYNNRLCAISLGYLLEHESPILNRSPQNTKCITLVHELVLAKERKKDIMHLLEPGAGVFISLSFRIHSILIFKRNHFDSFE